MYTILGSDQQQYGPVDHAGVVQWIQSGQANAQTLVFKQGEAGWKPLGEFAEFAGMVGGAPGMPGVAVQSGAAQTTQVPKVFGILNILFGLVCGGCSGLAALGIGLILGVLEAAGADTGVLKIVLPALAGLTVLFYVILVVAGIGLLMGKPWGRTLSVVYSIAAIVLSIAGLVVHFAVLPEDVSGGVKELIFSVIRLIYPIVLLIFMNKPEVKAALNK